MTHHPDPRADAWRAPTADDPPTDDIPGALGGSRLFEQPRYRAELDRCLAFIAPPGPVALEVGFDHGRRLASLAAADARTRWIGLEVRRRRVEALAAHAPPNLLAWRADARTVVRHAIPAGRLARVDVWFPTPWWHAGKRARRMLLTLAFLNDVARALAPDGALCVATDVEPYFAHLTAQLAGWSPAPLPPPAPTPSRREATCAREGIAVHRGAWHPPRHSQNREATR